jgi:formylglycine-generating enzyme required for sulfatase activity
MVMAYVPAGPFEMGSDSGESDEKPVHTVTLDAFWIDEHEMTNGMYDLCVQAGKCDPPNGSYFAIYEYADNPVVYVTWYDTLNYCEWAGARLPTEAEWEKAARGGLEGKIYPWGDESPVCTLATKSGAQYKSCSGQTAAVKSFAPNGYGLYDMAGNVWEWVSSLYKQYPYRSDDGRELNVIGSRVMRGGAWDTYEYSLRAANRDRNDPGNDYVNVGFRCARSP